MKALSIRQPWAWLTVHGHKLVENRHWITTYRGPLAIHASASLANVFQNSWAVGTYGIAPPPPTVTFGALIGWVVLQDCVTIDECSPGPFVDGPYCWLLKEPTLIEPVPWKGTTGLFDVPDHLFTRSLTPN